MSLDPERPDCAQTAASGPVPDGEASRPARRRPFDWFWLVVLIGFPLLALPGLGSAILWQDEAETALLGRSVAQHGYPLAHTGRQVISDQEDQRDINRRGLWIWTPWLQAYVVGAAFRLLGESTYVARLPFVLAGWAAVLVAYAFFIELTRDRRLARLAAFLLLTSVPYLLHVRQCRYYALVTLFTLIQSWGYVRLLRGGRYGRTMLIAGGAGLGQTFLPQLVASTAGFGLHAACVARAGRVLRHLVEASAWVAAMTLPFFIYSASWSRDYENMGYGFSTPLRYVASLRAYALEVHAFAWPFLLAIPLVWRWQRGAITERRRGESIALLVLSLAAVAALVAPPGPLTFATLSASIAGVVAIGASVLLRLGPVRDAEGSVKDGVVISGLTTAVTVALVAGVSGFPFVRYLTGVMPFCALLTAWTVGELTRWRGWAVLPLATLLSCTALFGTTPLVLGAGAASALVSPDEAASKEVLDFGHNPTNGASGAILQRFPGGDWGISPMADYLHEITHGYDGPVEQVIRYLQRESTPGETIVTTYEHFPLIFYTNLIAVRDYQQSRMLTSLPDWVYVHGPRTPQWPSSLNVALPVRYERVPVDGHDFPWDNIPEPYWHRFRTVQEGPPILLFRLRRTPVP